MAIDRLADAYPRHLRRSQAMLTAVTATGVIVLIAAQVALKAPVGVIVVTFVMASLTSVALNIVLIRYVLEPLDYLSRSVAIASGQVNDLILPNLNGTRHEHNGYRRMIDTVHELATATNEKSKRTTNDDNSISKLILDGVPGGVIALDEKRHILYSNTLAPVTSDEKGVAAIKLMFEGEDTLTSWLDTAEKTQLSAHTLWNRVQSALPGDPERKVYDVVATYHKNGKGGIDTLLLCFDQSKHYAVDEEDMDFIALAAHELRGPITVIKGYLDVLRPELEPKLDDEQRELMRRLEVSANRLSGYVSNILNASKFDRRHLKLHLHEDRIQTVYNIVADDLALRASTQNRMLQVKFPNDLPTIAVDSNSLSEVMANLIDNAIKYSREGGQVAVTARVDGNFIRFSVQDFGIGIPSAVVGNLFSKFYRSHRSKHVVAGTGLGLYISKAIVESHGGAIALTSTEGEGSIFSFTVPIYSTVKDKLLASDNENDGIIETNSGWIKNHSMYRS
jgi:signal transduction histidine kinase